ncbi:methionine synthase [Embleya sp. NBC_00896]|uniref:methionine synthase n=1 Tax=Embleya sp. NBC_00896 TaxID=2975961 RepID=UPI00386A848D|nr:methionine synthase [Embleya sp. NBC_00896]
MPGENIRETVKMVLGLLPDLPHLPELPARGPGADLTGRSAGVLVDLYTDVQPSGWRFVGRPGRDHRRAGSYLSEDLDALEEFTQGYTGPLKIQVAGPWTLAATIELTYGDKALADPGAVRDLATSLAEGIRLHVADVARRIPGATLLLQLDEPALPGVIAGDVPTASGFGRLRAVDKAVVRDTLRDVIADAGVPTIVHCCAPGTPITLLRQTGAAGVSLDFALLRQSQDESIGEAVEAGFGFFAGVVPSVEAKPDPAEVKPGVGARPLSDPPGTVRSVGTLWNRLGFPPESLGEAVVVTPTCGLAGASPAHARAALAHSVVAGRVLRDDPEGAMQRP